MLLAPAYSREAQLCVEINADGTMGLFNTLFTSFHFHTFVVPGCKVSFLVWGTATTPNKCKSEQFSTQFYILLLKGVNHMLKDFPVSEACQLCSNFCSEVSLGCSLQHLV